MSEEGYREPVPPAEWRFRRATTAVVLVAVVLAFLLGCSCIVASIFVARTAVSYTGTEFRVWSQIAPVTQWHGEEG
ncbi:MAG: hypothetical protein RQ731_00735 [Anaerosomatales bacterium]|nr:hypothetical protein [Anaerosomatales bacterium]MDT8433279.1 hypothetical protein [Anaerosomatales bacterium]